MFQIKSRIVANENCRSGAKRCAHPSDVFRLDAVGKRQYVGTRIHSCYLLYYIGTYTEYKDEHNSLKYKTEN